jgi:hypothetical protein
LGGSIKLSPADDIHPCGKSPRCGWRRTDDCLLSKNLRQAPPMLLLTFYRKNRQSKNRGRRRKLVKYHPCWESDWHRSKGAFHRWFCNP